MAVLAIDIGGSGSRAILRDGPTYTASGGPVRIVDGGLSISDALDSLAARLPKTEGHLDVVAVGMASLVAFGEPDIIAEQVRRRWRCRRVLLASDAVMALASAWGLQGGAVIAAGTGVVALTTDFAHRWRRIDGWGYHLGDTGGGAWIGARGLQAALRSVDGRAGGSSLLREKAEARFGALTALPAVISRASSPARTLAAFVPAVVSAAHDGDGIAARILSSAADELAAAAAAALTDADPPRIALVGGLAKIEFLVSQFERRAQQLVPDVQVVSGGDEPVHGALVLAEAVAAGDLAADRPPYLYISTTVPDQVNEQGMQ